MAEFETAYEKMMREHPEMLAKPLDVRTPEYTDSIEIGTPSKGGALKVYFNSSNLEEAKMRVNNAYIILEHGRKLTGV